MAYIKQSKSTSAIEISLENASNILIQCEITKAIVKYVLYNRGITGMWFDHLMHSYRLNSLQFKQGSKKLNHLKAMTRLFHCLSYASTFHIKKVALLLGSNHIAPKQTFLITFSHHCNSSLISAVDSFEATKTLNEKKQSKLIRKTVGEVIEAMVKWADTDADDNNANLSLQVMLQLLITPEDRNLADEFSSDEEEEDILKNKRLQAGDLLILREDFKLPKSGKRYEINCIPKKSRLIEDGNMSGLQELNRDEDDGEHSDESFNKDSIINTSSGSKDEVSKFKTRLTFSNVKVPIKIKQSTIRTNYKEGDGDDVEDNSFCKDSYDEKTDKENEFNWYKCDVVIKGFK